MHAGLTIVATLAVGALGTAARTTPADSESPPHPLTVDSMAADEAVLTVSLEGSDGVDERPRLAVYADGSFYVASTDVVGFEHGRLSADGIAGLLAAAASTDLLTPRDYGEQMITDVGATVVALAVDQGAVWHDAWALGHEGDVGGLTDEQAAARRSLQSFLAEVERLTTEDRFLAVAPGPYRPDVIFLHVAPVGWDSEFVPDVEGGVVAWPLDEALRDRRFAFSPWSGGPCTTVHGVEADAVLDEFAATGASTLTMTTVAGDVADDPMAVVWLRAALPGEEACRPGIDVDINAVAPLSTEATERLESIGFESPFPVGEPTTVGVFEEWSAIRAVLAAVSGPLGVPIDSVEASWFDTVAVGVELDGTRFVDVRALCSTYVTDEYEQCELWGRFDVGSGVVVGVELR